MAFQGAASTRAAFLAVLAGEPVPQLVKKKDEEEKEKRTRTTETISYEQATRDPALSDKTGLSRKVSERRLRR